MEIFEGFTGKKKKYIVADRFVYKSNTDQIVDFAKKLYHCKAENVMVTSGWIYDGLLYLENPRKKGQQIVLVAYHIGR